MTCFVATDQSGRYAGLNQTGVYSSLSQAALYTVTGTCVEVPVHYHANWQIPTGTINGTNMTFIMPGKKMEVYLNGLTQTFTKTATGFTLQEAPKAGDFLWCNVIIE